MIVKGRGFGRLNFGLIDLSGKSKRVDGSFGMGINVPIVEVVVDDSNEWIVYPQKYQDICLKLVKKLGISKKFFIKIKTLVPSHCGLGLGTQLRLTIAKALIIKEKLNVSSDELLRVVERGGTSNLGYYAFLFGNFIVEGGHLWKVEKEEIGPGIKFNCPNRTPIIYQNNFPNWGICLIIPHKFKKISGQEEINLFQKFCPIPKYETALLCKNILMGIIPAIQTKDFELFCYHLEQCMRLGLRKREILLRISEVKDIMLSLKSVGFKGIGMSSFGPIVFGFSRDVNEASAMVSKLKLSQKNKMIITTARNIGAEFTEVL